MLAELTDLLDALPPAASRQDYFAAATEANLLGKSTAATRRLTDQRLGELYGLDPGLTLFRVMRRLWPADPAGRPLLALLCALARDPLLRATAAPVLTLTPGAELVRATFLDALRVVVGSRLNDNVLDKVARNAASSWSQSGHLSGRMRKIRQRVSAHGKASRASRSCPPGGRASSTSRAANCCPWCFRRSSSGSFTRARAAA